MNGHMRIDYTGQDEHQYWSPLHLRYDSGGLFIVPLISRVNIPTISVFETLLLSSGAPM